MNTVFITGATSGIGQQLALDYAANGSSVIACGRNSDALSELKTANPNITALQFDITNLEQTKQALTSLKIEPDLWIFNAGDCEYIDDGKIDTQLIERVFSVNVIGLTNGLEACQSYFKRGNRVAIVGSIASELALPRAEAYGASKAAVSYLSRALRLDLRAKGIAVTTIYPGFVKTPLTDKNTFDMPMMVSVEQASRAIRAGLEKGKANIYFPRFFTSVLRLLGAMPYSWQYFITQKLVSPKQGH
jgi:short-subunit dehydrogenase